MHRIRKARKAVYIHGHMSWETMKQVNLDDRAYVFTFLREPEARLWSLYRFSVALPHEQRSAAVGDNNLSDRVAQMSPQEFFQSKEPRLQFDLNNYMVRAFAGALERTPGSDQEWRLALEQAKLNLSKLDFVGFHEQLDNDFNRLNQALHFPQVVKVPRENITSEIRGGKHSSSQHESESELQAVIQPLIRYDRELYNWAWQQIAGQKSSQ